MRRLHKHQALILDRGDKGDRKILFWGPKLAHEVVTSGLRHTLGFPQRWRKLEEKKYHSISVVCSCSTFSFFTHQSAHVFPTRLDEAAVALQKEKNMYKEIENFPMCFKVIAYFVILPASNHPME